MSTFVYFQTGCQKTGNSHITMMKNWVSHILFLRKRGAYRIPGSTEKGGYSRTVKVLIFSILS